MSELMIFNENRHERYKVRDNVVRLMRFERTTHSVGGYCSIQLSYRRISYPISFSEYGVYFLSYSASVRERIVRVNHLAGAIRHICGANHAV